MEEKRVEEKHSFLKVVSFIFGYIFLIVITTLSVWGTDNETPLIKSVLQGTLVELAGVCVIVFVFKYVFGRKLTAIKEYSYKISNMKIIIGIFLICPLLVFLKTNLLFNDLTNVFQVVEKSSWDSVGADLIYLPWVAILGAIFEEYCCRFTSICIFKTTKGKVIALIATTILFALCHVSSFVAHIPSGLIFGIALLWSKNLMLPIFMHMAWNTAAIIVPDLSEIVTMLLPGDVIGIWDSPIIVVVAFVISFIVGMILIVKNFKDIKTSNVRKKKV